MRDSDEGSNYSFRGVMFHLAIHFLFVELSFLLSLCLLSFHDTNPDCNPEIFPTEPLP